MEGRRGFLCQKLGGECGLVDAACDEGTRSQALKQSCRPPNWPETLMPSPGIGSSAGLMILDFFRRAEQDAPPRAGSSLIAIFACRCRARFSAASAEGWSAPTLPSDQRDGLADRCGAGCRARARIRQSTASCRTPLSSVPVCRAHEWTDGRRKRCRPGDQILVLRRGPPQHRRRLQSRPLTAAAQNAIGRGR